MLPDDCLRNVGAKLCVGELASRNCREEVRARRESPDAGDDVDGVWCARRTVVQSVEHCNQPTSSSPSCDSVFSRAAIPSPSRRSISVPRCTSSVTESRIGSTQCLLPCVERLNLPTDECPIILAADMFWRGRPSPGTRRRDPTKAAGPAARGLAAEVAECLVGLGREVGETRVESGLCGQCGHHRREPPVRRQVDRLVREEQYDSNQ